MIMSILRYSHQYGSKLTSLTLFADEEIMSHRLQIDLINQLTSLDEAL